MQTLRDLEVFQLAADMGSFSSAARRLDMTPAAVSMAIKRLEAELGVAVFLRSTRSLRLTTEGRIYLDHCRQALQLLADGRDAALTGTRALRGLLQLSLPSDLGRNVVLPWLDQFQQQHPELQLRLLVTDRLADIYRQPVDLALRYGTLPDSSLVALPIAPNNQRILCAAPAYLARYGQPSSPAALAEHNCLMYQHGDVVYDRWRLFQSGNEVSFQVSGNRSTDDGAAVRRWALDGYGIAYKSSLDVAEDLLAGRLVRLCPGWSGEPVPLNLLCAGRKQVSPLVQALRLFLTERCAEVLSRLAAAGV